jgi:hypothetical protein
VDEPEYRHIMGRVLNTIVKLMAVNQFEDTQCGFKLFSRKAAEDLFRIQRMNGIGFDVSWFSWQSSAVTKSMRCPSRGILMPTLA